MCYMLNPYMCETLRYIRLLIVQHIMSYIMCNYVQYVEISRRDQQREMKWLDMIKNWTQFMENKSSKVKTRVRKGKLGPDDCWVK